MLEKTVESPLDSKEIKPVNPEGNQPWIFIGRTDAEAEALILWPLDMKNWLIGKDPDPRKDWGQEEKRETEDKMVGWHHWLNGHESEQTPGDSEEQGSLAYCSLWNHKESDTTEWLSNNKLSLSEVIRYTQIQYDWYLCITGKMQTQRQTFRETRWSKETYGKDMIYHLYQERVLEQVLPAPAEEISQVDFQLLSLELWNAKLFCFGHPVSGTLWLALYTIGASQVALEVKTPPVNARDARDVGSIPGLGRSPGEGNGNPLQNSCLENSMGRGTLWATVQRVRLD